MTALIIIASIIAVIVLLLNIPVSAYIRYYGGEADIKVKYLMLTLYPKNERKGKAREDEPDDGTDDEEESTASEEAVTDEDSSTDNSSDDTPEKIPKRRKKPVTERINSAVDDLIEKKDAFLTLWELLEGHLKKLLSKIRIYGLVLDLAAADEDAKEAAMLYGKMNIGVYNAIAFIQSITPMKVRSVTIDCLYDTSSENTRYDGEVKIRLRPASVLNAVSAIIFGFLVKLKKYSPALNVFIKK